MNANRSTNLVLARVAMAAIACVGLASCGSQAAPGTGGSATGGSSGTGSAASGTMRSLTDQATEADGALACPASVADPSGQSVPVKPEGVDGAARLLPDRAPASMVVCAYPVLRMAGDAGGAQSGPPYKLSQRTVLTESGRASLAAQLSWAPKGVDKAPKACTAMGGDITNYLVGAMYGDAIVWVAAQHEPNNCPMASNGDFVSRESFGQLVAGAAGAISSAPEPPKGSCDTRTWGRLGDDEALAPEGAPLVTVCRPTNQGTYREFVMNETDSAKVVAALRALPATAWDSTCQTPEKADYSHDVRLLLTYATGPAVTVNVMASCEPGIVAAGGLKAQIGDTLLALIESVSPADPAFDPNTPISSDGTTGGVAPGGMPGGSTGGSTGTEPTGGSAGGTAGSTGGVVQPTPPVIPPDAISPTTPPPVN